MQSDNLSGDINYLRSKKILSAILGETVTRVAIERWSVRILFETAELIVEADWKLLDQTQTLQDQSEVWEQRKSFALWRVVGEKVSDLYVCETSFHALTVSFTNGMVLEIAANNDGLEDWSLAASNQAYWIVCNGYL